MIRSKIEDRVASIFIDDPPENKTAVTRLSSDLSDLCSKFAADDEIRVLVLIGSNTNSFSLGENLLENIWQDKLEFSAQLLGMTKALAHFNRPVLAAISGNAIGLGLELLLACDIRIASECANFGLPHILSGQIPWDGGTQRLSRVIGTAKALEMILTGEKISAKEAYRLGLINRIVPSSLLISTVREMAQTMADKSPIALEYAKEAIHKGMDLTLPQGMRLEADLYYLLHTTRDRREGIKAFQEKRKAHFEGK